MIRINGTGFSNVGLENELLVGGGLCSVVSATFTSVTCHSPFAASVENIDEVCHGGEHRSTCIEGGGDDGDDTTANNDDDTPPVTSTHEIQWGMSTTEAAASIAVKQGDKVVW